MYFYVSFTTYVDGHYLDRNISKFMLLSSKFNNKGIGIGIETEFFFTHGNLNKTIVSNLLIDRNLCDFFTVNKDNFYNIYSFSTPNDTYEIRDKTFFSNNSALFIFEA